MFRHAFARGGLWFFGMMIFIGVIGGPEKARLINDKGYSFWQELAITAVIALIVSCAVMFKTWYDSLEEQKPLEKECSSQQDSSKSL